MGKRKDAKLFRHQIDVDTLINNYQEQLASVNEGLSSLEDITDASQKILKLLKLNGVVSSMSYRFEYDLDDVAKKHVRDDRKFNKNGHVYSHHRRTKENELRQKNPGLDAIEKAISDKSAQIDKLLSETVRSCHGNLAEVARSRFYPQAWKEHEPLRDLFAAAKAAREALGEDVTAATPSNTAPPTLTKKAPVLRRN